MTHTEAQKGRLYLPTEIPDDIRRTVKNHLAEKFGGFTVIEARGGWVNEHEELVEEDVEVLEVAHGAVSTGKMSGMATWVQEHTEQSEVMWEVSNTMVGFES